MQVISTETERYWSRPAAVVLAAVGSSPNGLSSSEAARRLAMVGRNRLTHRTEVTRWSVLTKQLRNPLLLILVFAAVASVFTREWVDASIVATIATATVAITYWREYHAERACQALQTRMHVRVTVLRDDKLTDLPAEELVPGDIVQLSAGSLVPADGLILEATDCFVTESALTGESFPVQKQSGEAASSAPLRDRTNCLYLGTNIRSGLARYVVVHTAASTEFGSIAARLRLAPPETEFDRGLRRFGYFLTLVMVAMLAIVFIVQVLSGRPPIETLLFAVALAVGLSPELLPAILSVNLARGAQTMARRGVLVRRLNAIENLGSLDILCTDKTGTLTEGTVTLEGAYDRFGEVAAAPLHLAAVNALLESGLDNALDAAILAAERPDAGALRKLGEIPFDFVRKRVSVVIDHADGPRLIVKGAFDHVLEICTRTADGVPLDSDIRRALRVLYEQWGEAGIRVLAVAIGSVPTQPTYGRDLERDLTFAGLLTFIDRPKADASATLAALKRLGVMVKIISGDAKAVTQHVAAMVGLNAASVLTGRELDELDDIALWRRAEATELFVEVDPNQKERIIRALRHTGHVVGFLGDGVNDAPAMHAADTSISVEGAVDVARETADFVLLERDLDVIRQGIEEGRQTFANTLKYILTTMSANLGNMISMAAASFVLPFLPLLPGQILLNNFLSDVPAIGLADDRVDPELVERPRRWSIRFIARFMLGFGLLSSLFDFLTFAVLIVVFRASPALFRTGWFVESLLTELVIALVVRTERPAFKSRPGRLLLLSTIALSALTIALPYIPGVELLGFVPLPAAVMAAMLGTTMLYVLTAEAMKTHLRYRRA